MRGVNVKERSPLLVVGCLVLAAAGGCASGRTAATPLAFPGALGPAPGIGAEVAEAVLSTALAVRGTAYRLGGADPDAGFDCSGLVRYAFRAHRLELPRTVAEQFREGIAVDRRQASPGDLLFFATIADGPSHVGIVVDRTRFVHAPGTGQVVRVERFDTPYWEDRLLAVRRPALIP